MGRHTKVTAGGRVFSFSALVVLGDSNGTAGFGYGKGMTAGDAVVKANRDAEKFMFAVPLTDDRRIMDGFKVKQDGCTVELKVLPPGYGVRASPLMHRLCEAFGVTDVLIKARGRRNMKNVVRAFFHGMHDYPRSQRSIAEVFAFKWFDPRRDHRHPANRLSRTASNVWSPLNTRGVPPVVEEDRE
jgi:small subunit ribosomal protein S5